jgi:hypothetical protein
VGKNLLPLPGIEPSQSSQSPVATPPELSRADVNSLLRELFFKLITQKIHFLIVNSDGDKSNKHYTFYFTLHTDINYCSSLTGVNDFDIIFLALTEEIIIRST